MSLPDLALSHILIRDALARVAALADAGALDDYLACFTADASWELTAAPGHVLASMRLSGIEQIRESVVDRRASGIQGPGTHTAHHVASTYIDFDEAGTSATANSLFSFYTHLDAQPILAGFGRYTDSFRWLGGRWLLARRVIVQD